MLNHICNVEEMAGAQSAYVQLLTHLSRKCISDRIVVFWCIYAQKRGIIIICTFGFDLKYSIYHFLCTLQHVSQFSHY